MPQIVREPPQTEPTNSLRRAAELEHETLQRAALEQEAKDKTEQQEREDRARAEQEQTDKEREEQREQERRDDQALDERRGTEQQRHEQALTERTKDEQRIVTERAELREQAGNGISTLDSEQHQTDDARFTSNGIALHDTHELASSHRERGAELPTPDTEAFKDALQEQYDLRTGHALEAEHIAVGQQIEGEVLDVVQRAGSTYLIVETDQGRKFAEVQLGHGYAKGDAVEITRTNQGYEVAAAREYGL